MSLTRPTVIGVDPGPTPGIAVVRPDGSVECLQVTAGVLEVVLRALILDRRVTWLEDRPGPAVLLAVERYVVGRRSGRSSDPGASETTRRQVGALEALAHALGAATRLRSAAEVKPWATDARLTAAGLAPKGMTHARDAGRHALYAAVHDCGLPDPLSRKARA